MPCIVRWPGHVSAGQASDAIFALIDRWKLLLPGCKSTEPHRSLKDFGTDGLELYDLEADVGEIANLVGRHPDIVRALKARLAAARENRASLWRAQPITRDSALVSRHLPFLAPTLPQMGDIGRVELAIDPVSICRTSTLATAPVLPPQALQRNAHQSTLSFP